MHVLVALKWVALRPEVDPLSGAVTTDARFSGPGPADCSALEWALRLVEGRGAGSVTAVTVGPPEAEAMLRDALALGATRAVQVAGLPDDASSRAVAAELAALATGCNLVVCGNASLDRGSGAVPAFVAHELGWAQALGLVTLESPEPAGPLVAHRRLDGGRRERLAVPLPAVVSFEAGPELRRASLSATLSAATALVEVRPAVAVDRPAPPTVLARRPFRPPARVVPAPHGSTRQRLDTLLGAGAPSKSAAQALDVSPEEAARLTVEHLTAWGYLDLDLESDLDPQAPGLGGTSASC